MKQKTMNYTQEMNLVSKSGYCMPFEESKGEVSLTLGYGKQIHPMTQEEFFHHGVDFATHRYILTAVADGVVSGIGSNPTHGLYQVIRYGKYEVTYAHLANALAPFGARVKAGSVVGISGVPTGSGQRRLPCAGAYGTIAAQHFLTVRREELFL